MFNPPVDPAQYVRLCAFLPKEQQNDILSLMLGDSQLKCVAQDYFKDSSFCRAENGDINLWRLYNLLTSANKSTYIDSFIEKSYGSKVKLLMLHNVPLLSNQELQHLFVSETKRFIHGLDQQPPFKKLKEIKENLQQISRELDKRRDAGLLNN